MLSLKHLSPPGSKIIPFGHNLGKVSEMIGDILSSFSGLYFYFGLLLE